MTRLELEIELNRLAAEYPDIADTLHLAAAAVSTNPTGDLELKIKNLEHDLLMAYAKERLDRAESKRMESTIKLQRKQINELKKINQSLEDKYYSMRWEAKV